MKKSLLSVIILLVLLSLANIVYAGSLPNWKLTALNTTTYTAVELPANKGCGDILVYVSDGSACLAAKNSAGLDERPFLADISEGWGSVCPIAGTDTIFWMKATSGTPNAVVLFLNK